MEFYILDENFDIIGIVDTYKSAIWTERYYESGDFELYMPVSEEILNLFRSGKYVIKAKDRSRCMILEKLSIESDEENGDYIIATGRSLSSILSRRIVWKQTSYSGRIENTIRKLVDMNFIHTDIAARKIANMEMKDPIGLTEILAIQYTGDNVEEAIQDICKTYKIGYDIELDFKQKKLKFYLYKGTNRSYSQTENPYVVFSQNYENLLTSTYTNDKTEHKNVAQIAGSGEGTARIKTTVGSATGIERREVFVNASQTSDNSGEIEASAYLNMLAQEGFDKLAELKEKENMEAEIAANQTYKLNEDYFLGDVVEIIDEWEHKIAPRVTEVIECQSDTGYSCVPTLELDED